MVLMAALISFLFISVSFHSFNSHKLSRFDYRHLVSRTPPRKTPRRRMASPRCPQALRLPRSTTCWRDHIRGRPPWRKRSRLRKPRKKIIRIFLPKRICFEVLFNLNRHGFPCGTLTESIWEWISARRRLSLSLIGPHCRHSSPGIMRFMNASNNGTVKAVSP